MKSAHIKESRPVAGLGVEAKAFESWSLLLWVGHRPGRARLGMGLGAIGAFAPVSGSDSSDEYKDRLHHGTDATGHGGPGSQHVTSSLGSGQHTSALPLIQVA